MSFDNINRAKKDEVYSYGKRPPVRNCGGDLDKEGNDSYWGKSMTVQADESNANIHTVMERYARTGQLPPVKRNQPLYGDFSNVRDYQSSMNIVLKAQDQFLGLDAKLRARFGNDPAYFLEFMEDPSNLDEAVKLGLAVKRDEANSKPPIPSKEPVVVPPKVPEPSATPKPS